MLHIVLYQPEIPPNTGNVIRLAANTGSILHLIRPLGFSMDDRLLRRAGLDYHEWATIQVHGDWPSFLDSWSGGSLYGFSTKGTRRFTEAHYRSGDALVFGPETRGLPPEILQGLPADHVLRIPMRPEVRSLNLSNAVSVVVYEACRQQDFRGLS